MISVLTSSAATENSRVQQGAPGVVNRFRFTVTDEGAWNGTLKFAARAQGRGYNRSASTFPMYLPITKLDDGSTIAAGTGVTAAGNYEIDTSGLEWRCEHTRVAGAVSVEGDNVQG